MKAAILIDGGYFLKRLGRVRRGIDLLNAEAVDDAIGQLVENHLKQLNKIEKAGHPYSLLYRCFFYDALPYMAKGHLPISGKAIDYAKSDQATFRLALFDRLRRRANFAVRLGQVRKERSWILSEAAQKAILKGTRTPADLTDEDFYPGFRQKAVDMRIGVDIASISLKRQADTIILVAGDSDFVPASKLARREGIRITDAGDGMVQVQVFGVDVFKPQTGEVQSEGTDGIALWMLDTDYNEESFFVPGRPTPLSYPHQRRGA